MSQTEQTDEQPLTLADVEPTLHIPPNVVVDYRLDYFLGVVRDAIAAGVLDKFRDMIRQLSEYASGSGRLTRVHLFPDFAPMSFRFAREIADPTPYGMAPTWQPWFQGGVIYSGPTPDDPEYVASGLAPALSVSVGDPGVGWSVHT